MNVIEFVVLPILVHIAEIRIPMRNIKSGKKEKNASANQKPGWSCWISHHSTKKQHFFKRPILASFGTCMKLFWKKRSKMY